MQNRKQMITEHAGQWLVFNGVNRYSSFRLIKIIPLYPYSKPYSTGTHNETVEKADPIFSIHQSNHDRILGGRVLPLWPNRGSGLFEGPAKDYQMAQFREITLPLRGILVVTTL